MSYNNDTQQKNLAWVLPRPKLDKYPGGMPLHCEAWLIALAKDLLGKQDIKLLNVFCGMNQQGLRVDIKPEVNPDVVCDAHCLHEKISETFDVILADPPYSNQEAAERYGTPKLCYKTWANECIALLNPGGLLIVYHKVLMPNPNPTLLLVEKRVFIGSRINHPPRVAIYFRKKETQRDSMRLSQRNK